MPLTPNSRDLAMKPKGLPPKPVFDSLVDFHTPKKKPLEGNLPPQSPSSSFSATLSSPISPQEPAIRGLREMSSQARQCHEDLDLAYQAYLKLESKKQGEALERKKLIQKMEESEQRLKEAEEKLAEKTKKVSSLEKQIQSRPHVEEERKTPPISVEPFSMDHFVMLFEALLEKLKEGLRGRHYHIVIGCILLVVIIFVLIMRHLALKYASNIVIM
ncbi:hypothetical protein ADUPG1_012950 [Aduncisulcus paluster]|uniref:Uncharacterized protein n=1 Tax=Aduncisulcus paluster TaxID=2918883 RepID=A0ABQ5K185_9EUKA|nr:hypothetical protein ADUPG1_012950 [Aduncisulcus paluster]